MSIHTYLLKYNQLTLMILMLKHNLTYSDCFGHKQVLLPSHPTNSLTIIPSKVEIHISKKVYNPHSIIPWDLDTYYRLLMWFR